MRIVIYQPSFIPWLGYFDLFLKADIFVFYDDVQFTKRDWRNRNRIRTNAGWKWLTIPVKLKKPYYEYKIYEVEIDRSENWVERHLKTLYHFYKRSKHFESFFQILENLYIGMRERYLEDFVIKLFFEILDYLECPQRPKVFFSKDLEIPQDLRKTERLIYIIKKYFPSTTEYLTGITARNYLVESLFEDENIKVVWHEYSHPYYNQLLWGTNIFISHLSIVDLIFNHGKDSCDILTGKKIIDKPPYIKIIAADDLNSGRLYVNDQKRRL